MEQKREFINVAGSIIGLLLVGIVAFLAWALVFRTIPEQNREAMNWLMAILSAQVGIVVGFYFGNTIGAKKQAETMDKVADLAHAVQPKHVPDIKLKPGESANVEAEK